MRYLMNTFAQALSRFLTALYRPVFDTGKQTTCTVLTHAVGRASCVLDLKQVVGGVLNQRLASDPCPAGENFEHDVGHRV